MKKSEADKIRKLIIKYNDILLHSMSIAVSEDLINLIITNYDDKEFELKDFIKRKEEFKSFVIKEFLRHNSSSVVEELKNMEEPTVRFEKKGK